MQAAINEKSHTIKLLGSLLAKLEGVSNEEEIQAILSDIVRVSESAHRRFSFYAKLENNLYAKCALFCDLPLDHPGDHWSRRHE